MNKLFRVSFFALALASMAFLSACDEEDPPLPDNIAEFQSSAQGLGASETEVTVNIKLDRAVETAGNISVTFVGTGVAYGEDFTTDPAATGSTITIPLAVGATSASFKVTKTNTNGLEGTEKVVFTITSVADGLVLGDAAIYTLTFSEIIATEAEMQVNGGGTNSQNRVFIDLSGNKQTAVARSTWDLAFATGADQWRVVLNSSNKMLAYQTEATELAEITAEDTLGLGAMLSTDAIFATIASLDEGEELPEWVAGSTAWMDDRSGDLSKTAIAEISGTDVDNYVYIINRGTDANNESIGWLKIKVTRNGNAYQLEYAEIDAEATNTATIAKNDAYNFTYFSFDSGSEVDVEPAKEDWDIAWTGFTNTTSFGGPPFPYYNADIILTNIHGGAKAFTYYTTQATPAPPGVVYTGDETYETFTAEDLSVITNYGTSQLTIGATWRALNPPPGGATLYETRFYIIEDADGNIYKLKFTALIVNGERGKPEFKYELLTKGS